jgi:hypothetical protein
MYKSPCDRFRKSIVLETISISVAFKIIAFRIIGRSSLNRILK